MLKENSLKNIGLQFFAEPSDAGSAVSEQADAGNPTTEQSKPETEDNQEEKEDTTDYKALFEKLKKENEQLSKNHKQVNDELNKAKKAIRASKSAEEQAAEEAAERQQQIEEELKTLRKQAAISNISKKIMTFVSDEKTANEVSEYLYGAEDVDAAIDAISKAWNAREKKLRLEYGKIPSPGNGNGEEDPQKANIELAKKFGRERNSSFSTNRSRSSKYMIGG